MIDGDSGALHYVVMLDEARELVESHDRFWVSNCGCRERRGNCKRSRIDLCLYFTDTFPPSGSGLREASREDVDAIVREAESKSLVARPFRSLGDRSLTDGICFCCDDCCGYFADPTEACDKGTLIERTDSDECTNCGGCVAVCYFGARVMNDAQLHLDDDRCYGCGLCVRVCPVECIEMVAR